MSIEEQEKMANTTLQQRVESTVQQRLKKMQLEAKDSFGMVELRAAIDDLRQKVAALDEQLS